MSQFAIRVENLSKTYQINPYQGTHKTFREELVLFVNHLKTSLYSKNIEINPHTKTVWALKEVSFNVKFGEVLGIIGQNGAGKSTILKILSRVTNPTEGQIELFGRVGSLLEVGMGFHSELTGRENIFLSGAVLGMKKAEIKAKFDEIVSFAEVETFVDTPVKRYSSGMYVRLAFAVAAHLEPEILLIDEVLAVGDLAFQKKCLGKVGNLSREGRTVIFISHDMGSIRHLCTSAMWIDQGQKRMTGEVYDVTHTYEEKMYQSANRSSTSAIRDTTQIDAQKLHIRQVEMLNAEKKPTLTFRYNDQIILNILLAGMLKTGVFSAEFYLYNELGQLVSVGASGPYHNLYFEKNVKKIEIVIGPIPLTSGNYMISLSLVAGSIKTAVERIDTWHSAIGFTIIECQPFDNNWDIPTHREGVFVIPQKFQAIS